MSMNKSFERLVEYENDKADFKMPYRNYGKQDKEIMLAKYMRLTNRPNHVLETRFQVYQW
jgi:hypothetical protein